MGMARQSTTLPPGASDAIDVSSLARALLLHRLAHRWPCRDPIEVPLQRGPALQLDSAAIRPTQHREEVRVRDGEALTHQELALLEELGEEVELFAIRLAHHLLRLVGRAGEERLPEALVQLGGDVVEPFLELVAFQAARFGNELCLRLALRQVLEDGDALGEHRSVVELQRGHVALRVDRSEVLTRGRLAGLGVDALEVEGKAELTQDDVRRQRANPWLDVELHSGSSVEKSFDAAGAQAFRRPLKVRNCALRSSTPSASGPCRCSVCSTEGRRRTCRRSRDCSGRTTRSRTGPSSLP